MEEISMKNIYLQFKMMLKRRKNLSYIKEDIIIMTEHI